MILKIIILPLKILYKIYEKTIFRPVYIFLYKINNNLTKKKQNFLKNINNSKKFKKSKVKEGF